MAEVSAVKAEMWPDHGMIVTSISRPSYSCVSVCANPRLALQAGALDLKMNKPTMFFSQSRHWSLRKRA